MFTNKALFFSSCSLSSKVIDVSALAFFSIPIQNILSSRKNFYLFLSSKTIINIGKFRVMLSVTIYLYIQVLEVGFVGERV